MHSKDEKKPAAKKPYESPKLTFLGSLANLPPKSWPPRPEDLKTTTDEQSTEG